MTLRVLPGFVPYHRGDNFLKGTSMPAMPQPPPAGLFETVRREMRLRGYSQKTIKAYQSCIRTLVRHFRPKHPRELSDGHLRSFLLHLLEDEQWEASSVNQMINALRFLYVELYRIPMSIGAIPRPKKEKKLPVVLSPDEVKRSV